MGKPVLDSQDEKMLKRLKSQKKELKDLERSLESVCKKLDKIKDKKKQ